VTPRLRHWSLAIAAASAAACSSPARRPGAPTAGPPPARAVEVVEVASAGQVGVTVPAVVRARDRATITARLPGAVIALPVREGKRVAQGAVVVRLEDGALNAALQAARAALRSSQADHDRLLELLAASAATPQQVEQAEARVATARAAVSVAREQLAYAVIRAPFAGTVASRPADVGDGVSPGAVLLEIEGDGALELAATVDGNQARALAEGTRLQATVDGHDGPLEVTVVSLSTAGDPLSHRFELRAALPSSARLRSGVFARLTLPGAGEAGPVVPSRAVFARGGLSGVFVADGSTARLRWIAAGQPAGDLVEVRAGLSAGERVVLQPAGLEDGVPIVVR
jgi:membrane fusion protein (multidrug efflux system)